MSAGRKKRLKCSKCGKTVTGYSVIKHLWSDHRDHMMRNHKGGFFAKKSKTPTATKTEQKPMSAILYEVLGAVLGHKTKEQAFDAITHLVLE